MWSFSASYNFSGHFWTNTTFQQFQKNSGLNVKSTSASPIFKKLCQSLQKAHKNMDISPLIKKISLVQKTMWTSSLNNRLINNNNNCKIRVQILVKDRNKFVIFLNIFLFYSDYSDYSIFSLFYFSNPKYFPCSSYSTFIASIFALPMANFHQFLFMMLQVDSYLSLILCAFIIQLFLAIRIASDVSIIWCIFIVGCFHFAFCLLLKCLFSWFILCLLIFLISSIKVLFSRIWP